MEIDSVLCEDCSADLISSKINVNESNIMTARKILWLEEVKYETKLKNLEDLVLSDDLTKGH